MTHRSSKSLFPLLAAFALFLFGFSPRGWSQITFSSATQSQEGLQPNQPYGQGTINQRLLRIDIVTGGTAGSTPLSVSKLKVSLTGHQGIARLSVFSNPHERFFPSISSVLPYGSQLNPGATVDIPLVGMEITKVGTTYLWLLADIKPTAPVGTVVDAVCQSLDAGGATHVLPSVVSSHDRQSVVALPLTGVKTVRSSGGDYATVLEAIRSLNDYGVSIGGVQLVLTDGEVYAQGVTGNEYQNYFRQPTLSTSPLVIRRSGTGSSLPQIAMPATASTSDVALGFLGSDHVTVDGLEVVCSARHNNNGLENGIIFSGMKNDGCNNNVVRNCVFDLDNTNQGRSAAIRFLSVASEASSGVSNGNKLHGNRMKNCDSGVAFNVQVSPALTHPDSNNEIYNNTLTGHLGVENGGIALRFVSNTRIYGNVIDGSGSPVSVNRTVSGIRVSESMGDLHCHGNTVRNLTNAHNGTNASVVGIDLVSEHVYLYNNMIANLSSTATTSTSRTTSGIDLQTSVSIQPVFRLWHNSVYLHMSTPSGHSTSAVRVVGNSRISIASMQNNIFVNTSTGGSANYVFRSQYKNTGILTASAVDNNLYYPDVPDAFSYRDLTVMNLFDYKNQVKHFDQNAISELPPFVSMSDLHIRPGIATWVEGGGCSVPDVSKDIDGNTRHATYPDIGADEGEHKPVNIAPVMVPVGSVAPINNNAGQQTIRLTGISDGNPTTNQTVTITAVSNLPAVVPNPVVEYVSGSSTALLKFTPTGSGRGRVSITVTLKDNGGTDNGGVDVSKYTFIVNVMQPNFNNPPTIDPVAEQFLLTTTYSHSVPLSGITDGDPTLNQNVSIRVETSPEGIISRPELIYIPNQTTGTLQFAPRSIGETTVKLILTDDGNSSGGHENTCTITFPVKVERIQNFRPGDMEYGFWLNTDTIPRLPIGINLAELTYYSPEIPFTDVMKTAKFLYDWTSFEEPEVNVPVDPITGYPTAIPFEGQEKTVRFMINNFYIGRYVVLYDGDGELKFYPRVSPQVIDGKTYITLDGKGGHVWIDMKKSNPQNPIRNIRILPEQYSDGRPYPTFRDDYLTLLKPFYAVRFMDWLHTNSSSQQFWSDRTTPQYYSQAAGYKGNRSIALEYCIELCNELEVDGWFCIPHKANDEYIRNFATMIKNTLKPNLKAYFEYSNEVWNSDFGQYEYLNRNAPGATDQYVIDSLQLIAHHAAKRGFMASRLIKILHEVFPEGAQRRRIVTVAATHHMGGQTGHMLAAMKNRGFRIMPDMVSPGGYFSFRPSCYEVWKDREFGSITVDTVITKVLEGYPDNEYRMTCTEAAIANEYGLGFCIYEGGQHVAPDNDRRHRNNPIYHHFDSAIWEAQLHPQMFNMYMTNFRSHTLPYVNCRLFMAYSFIGPRESLYGSFGHLERLMPLNMDSLILKGQKYNALLYSAKPKADYLRAPTAQLRPLNAEQMEVTLQTESPGGIIYYSLDGKYPFSLRYTEPLVLPTGTTVYAVTAKVGYAYSNTSKILARKEQISVPDANHLQQETSRSDVVVYPNPASDYLNIALDSPQQGTVMIYSAAGVPVCRQEFNAGNIRVNLTSLPPGYYIVKVISSGRPPYAVKVKRQ